MLDWFLLSVLCLGFTPILLNALPRNSPSKYLQALETNHLPKISVLLAVRNEAEYIQDCLSALAAVDYPNFEVLIADDASEDNTAAIIAAFIEPLPHFRLYYLGKDDFESSLYAKARVLSFLAEKARGEHFALTDADVQVPKSWLRALVSNADTQTGIVAGITLPPVRPLFAYYQRLDWAWAFASMLSAQAWGLSTTAAGNNMLLSREAYERVGGYAAQGDSLTEDFALSRAILKAGFGIKYAWQVESLAHTKAEKSLFALWQQRKRWMQGAMRLPLLLKIALILPLAWYPCWLVLLMFKPMFALGFYLLRIGVFTYDFRKIFSEIQGKKPSIGRIVIYDLWANFFQISLLIYYLLPIKIKWKGRQF